MCDILPWLTRVIFFYCIFFRESVSQSIKQSNRQPVVPRRQSVSQSASQIVRADYHKPCGLHTSTACPSHQRITPLKKYKLDANPPSFLFPFSFSRSSLCVRITIGRMPCESFKIVVRREFFFVWCGVV